MNKQRTKKTIQLGMDPGTAANKLRVDLLFMFALQAGHRCFHCGLALTRETFSIEHKIPWLDSENPNSLFFDLTNIGFSHLKCNVSAARKYNKTWTTPEGKIEHRRTLNRNKERRLYTTERRQKKYAREKQKHMGR